MTDRIRGFVVALDRDYREDDVEGVRSAISIMRGVISVGPIVAKPDSYIADARALDRLRDRVWAALTSEQGGKP